MKFLKASVVILFLLSLSSAGLTLYLSSIRENEKTKRLEAEAKSHQLEEQAKALKTQIQELETHFAEVQEKTQGLEQELSKEQEARLQFEGLLQEKNKEIQNIIAERDEAEKAFANAQKRNRQLEEILDELEGRIKQMDERQFPSQPEVGYVELEMKPEAKKELVTASGLSAVSAKPSVNSEKSVGPISNLKTNAVPVQKSTVTAPKNTPAAQTPKKKKKGFFSFLGFGKSDAPKKEEKKAEPVKKETPKLPETPKPAVPKVQAAVKAPASSASSALSPQMPAQAKPVEVPVSRTAEPKITVQSASAAKKAAAATKGKVLLVNRKFNFVVVDLGSRQGLALNDMMAVEQGNAQIAKVRVEKIYDDYCAAYIVEEQSNVQIQDGDSVRVL